MDRKIFETKGGKVELTHTENSIKVDAYSYKEEKAFSTEVTKNIHKAGMIDEIVQSLNKTFTMLPETLKELEQWMERII